MLILLSQSLVLTSISPRDAAMLIARLANHRNPHISILALALLDTLVQSCGYPFHLQIATKEFLNELVRRFPERPPPFPGPVMSRILELIQRWKEGICSESRWKEDLGNIRDMHRLLTFKGYRFREMSRRVEAPTTMVSLFVAHAYLFRFTWQHRTSSPLTNLSLKTERHNLLNFKNLSVEAPRGTWRPRKSS